jgi:hypothetical protein
MNVALSARRHRLNRAAVTLIVAGLLLLLAAANFHLVYVAVSSQPGCVPHLTQGGARVPDGSFSAATSACSPGGPT